MIYKEICELQSTQIYIITTVANILGGPKLGEFLFRWVFSIKLLSSDSDTFEQFSDNLASLM